MAFDLLLGTFKIKLAKTSIIFKNQATSTQFSSLYFKAKYP